MIAAQLDAATTAFARLRAMSFAERRLLAERAADVVARQMRFESVDETP